MPEPWLVTNGGTAIDGRQLYPFTASEAKTPVIKMAAQFVAPTAGQLIGLIRVAANFQVRGRRLQNTTATSVALMIKSAGLTFAAVQEELLRNGTQ